MKVGVKPNHQGWRQAVAPIVRGVGILLHVPALMACLSMVVCLVFAEYRGIRVLLITALACVLCGQVLYWLSRIRGRQAVLASHAMLIAALAWLLISLLGSIPFMLGAWVSPLNAMFESVSGFTGTGLSLLNPEQLPHYLQWWRSFSQWVGGVGVILLMLTLLPRQRGALDLYYSEARSQKLAPSVRETARLIWSIYGMFTCIAIVGLWLAGLPPWQAVNHGLTSISTGGFTITEDSLTNAPIAVKLVYVPLMLAGAVSFYTHYQVFHERHARYWILGSEYRLFWFIVIFGTLVLAINNIWLQDSGFVDSTLQWISAVTTTGVQAKPLPTWHSSTLFLLSLAMCVGGIAGSTTGGIKMLRLMFLYKSVVWSIVEIARKPHQLLRFALDGRALTSSDAHARVRAAITLVVAWVVTTMVAVYLMTYFVPAYTPLQFVLFDVLSAQSGEGLSSGLVYDGMSVGARLVLMAVMWMGRLEIIPVLVLLMVLLNRSISVR